MAHAQMDNADMRTAMMMYVEWGGVSVVGSEREQGKTGPQPHRHGPVRPVRHP